MHFIKKREFYDYIHEHFEFPRGATQIMRVEETGSEDEVYLFVHGGRYDRTTRQSEGRGADGVYVLYENYFDFSEEDIVQAIEEWYGQKIESVVGTHKIDGGLGVLAKVPYPSDGFWWDKP